VDKVNDHHDFKGWMKFEEGDLIASPFLHLEIDFHLRLPKNLIFINMLRGPKVGPYIT
jgi:hypothetical protein